MFYLTARVGTMFAVYDDSDNTVEWFDKNNLDNFLDMGIQIMGYSKSAVNIVNNISIPYDKCFWSKSKKCLFDVATRAYANNCFITIIAENKKYKCKVLGQVQNGLAVKFSNGIMTAIPFTWLRKMGVVE